ncbi:MAG: ABC transporter ATP-binding protein [Pyrinomonadaceae bacterium]|nr:ABC transporter ATP-binding protein [Pyrinomonadaceae bacterium]MCX7639600.1 ABC transporter ATP-binding protein [Pyrinomonadaceae bacterium]MDW8303993.1 ABC transporter ATP-binding protein [Acidobacteriota bacterium]
MLELRNITKRFGNVVANRDVSIKVKPATIHAIVGENGAGKSTIMRIAFGFYKPDAGEIFFDGKRVEFSSPHDAIRLGIGMVHQHFTLVENMTVTENIILGAETGNSLGLDIERAEREISELSERLKLKVNPKALVEDLSVGEQQRVELLKALYRKANFLILDEPTAVLTPQEIEELFSILRRMRDEGKTVVIITHKLEEVLAVSDYVTVMRDGQVVGNLKTSETNARELARMIVGRDVLLRVEKVQSNPGNEVLRVEDLVVESKHGIAVRGVSLNVRAGEIVGIAGIEGNGQTELIEALAGLIPVKGGRILFLGKEISNLGVRERIELGIAHIPEDRHKRGLFLNFDLRENAILGIHYRKPIVSNGLLDLQRIEEHTRQVIQNFDVRPANPFLIAKSLSGGNQQKLVVGREISLQPKLLLVSQPTRGVDIGAIEFIHRKLVELRDKGSAILLVSAELEEVKSLADRLLVIRQGRIVGEVDPSTVSVERLGLMMTSG